MTELDLLKAPPSAYMDITQLNFFQERLLTQKTRSQQIIESTQRQLRERHELNDESDLALHAEDLRMALRIVERETKLLNKIDAALVRIQTGEYGYCLSSGDPIGLARLLVRPTAEYCTEIKNQMEEREKHYAHCR